MTETELKSETAAREAKAASQIPMERATQGVLTLIICDASNNHSVKDIYRHDELKAWLFDLIVKYPSYAQNINGYYKVCIELDVFKMKEFRIIVNSDAVLIWTRN